MCVVLKTLHSVKHILNKEECRSIGEGSSWWDDELAVVIATKPPGAVQETLGAFEEHFWNDSSAEKITSKLCSTRS